MGKALYNMKFYSASLSYFDRIVQKGPSHALLQRHAEVAGVAVARSCPIRPASWRRSVSTTAPSSISPRSRRCATSSTSCSASSTTRRATSSRPSSCSAPCRPTSEFYVQAKLFEGATHVREYQAKPAVEAFKEVLRTAAESTDPRIKPFEDLANLSLARTFYSTGQFELATKYFDRVSQESYDWANSLFESSWANFMLKQKGYSKALGNIHTIQAPFFENYIKPESVGEGADGQGDHLLLQLPLRPRAGGDRRVQRRLPDGVHRAQEADRRHQRERPAVRPGGQDSQGDVGPAGAGRARGARRPRRHEPAQALPVRRGAGPRAQAARARRTRPGSRPTSRRRCSPT